MAGTLPEISCSESSAWTHGSGHRHLGDQEHIRNAWVSAKLHIRETIAFETKKAEFVEKLLILTIGPHTFMDHETVYAWREAGVELIGPVLSISQISRVAIGLVVGAIIDLDLDIDALIRLTDQLDGLGIPAVFATSQTGKAQTSGFCLSREREAIAAITAALLLQRKVTKH